MIVSHQEYVRTIYGNDATNPEAAVDVQIPKQFQSVTYGVNPGLSEVFPMLAQFANNFENYEMLQCVFHFETLLDEGVFQSTTGQVGDILLYSHLNSDEPDLQNVSEFIQAGGSISRATKGSAAGVECAQSQLHGLPNEGINKVRTGPVNTQAGIVGQTQEFDQAKFQVAVSNTPKGLIGKPIGRLYVSYTVRLIKPKLATILGRGQLKDIFSMWDHGAPVIANQIIPMFPPKVVTGGGGWFKHKKNQIGCDLQLTEKVGATTADILKITFPDWFQGTVMLLFKWDQIVMNSDGDERKKAAGKLLPQTFDAGTGAQTSPGHKLPFKTINTYGNVLPFDALLKSPEDGEQHASFYDGGLGTGDGGDFATNGSGNNNGIYKGWFQMTVKISLPNATKNEIIFTAHKRLAKRRTNHRSGWRR